MTRHSSSVESSGGQAAHPQWGRRNAALKTPVTISTDEIDEPCVGAARALGSSCLQVPHRQDGIKVGLLTYEYVFFSWLAAL